MVKKMLVVLSMAVMVGASTPVTAYGCPGCDKVASSGEGFCCGKGMAFGVQLKSKKLQAALVGHSFDGASACSKCSGCKSAAKDNGWCDDCNVGIVGKEYFTSPVSYSLAKGKVISAEKMKGHGAKCSGCKTAHADNGRCDHCKVGFVAGRMFQNKEEHTAALAAYKTLTKAADVAGKCEACAVAMVSDGECEHCKVSFKNGKVQG